MMAIALPNIHAHVQVFFQQASCWEDNSQSIVIFIRPFLKSIAGMTNGTRNYHGRFSELFL